MGTKVFGFIYRTLRAQANNPANPEYFLPTVLQGVDNPDGGKLLPLVGKDWNLGEVQGEGGTLFQKVMKDQWWYLVNYNMKKAGRGNEVQDHQPIPCPTAPWPRFSLPAVTVYGLDNVLLLDNPLTTMPATGYQTTMTLQFGYYQGQNGLPNLSAMILKGQYGVDQCVCSAPATAAGAPIPTACDNWVPSANIRGTGNFTATLTDVFVDVLVDVQVAGTGAARQLTVTVDQLTMRGGSSPLPQLAVTDMTVDSSLNPMLKNMWLQKANEALTSPQGRAGLIANLNANLNQPPFRGKLQEMLNRQLTTLINDNLGAPTPNLQTGTDAGNPVDQLMLDRVRDALNNPVSPYYLPKVVCGNTSPVLEPLAIDQTVSVPDQNIAGIPFQNIKLTNLKVSGLSNIVAPADQFQVRPTEDGLNTNLYLSTLSAPPLVTVTRGTVQVPPPPMAITGNFTFTVPDVDQPMGGTLNIQVQASTLHAEVLTAGDDVDSLVIRFNDALQVKADLNNIRVNVQMDSEFLPIINEMFNQPSIKNQALQVINSTIHDHLADLGREATQAVQKVIKAKMHA